MSILKSILVKLGLVKEDVAAPASAAPATKYAASAPDSRGAASTATKAAAPPPKTASRAAEDPRSMRAEPRPDKAPARPTAIDVVDVVSMLEGMAARNSENLSWKNSIVDLLKLLGLESSLAFRKDLATELGCPEKLMGDSAQMNMWLHKTVLKKIADNGGNIPANLLD